MFYRKKKQFSSFTPILYKYYLSIYPHMCHSCMWRSEENVWELILSFHIVWPGDTSQVVRLDDRGFYSWTILLTMLLLLKCVHITSFFFLFRVCTIKCPGNGNCYFWFLLYLLYFFWLTIFLGGGYEKEFPSPKKLFFLLMSLESAHFNVLSVKCIYFCSSLLD